MELLLKFKIMKEDMELSIKIHKLRKELKKLKKEEMESSIKIQKINKELKKLKKWIKPYSQKKSQNAKSKRVNKKKDTDMLKIQ